MKPKLTSAAILTIILLIGVLVAGNYAVLHNGPLGQVIVGWLKSMVGAGYSASLVYFIGAPVIVGLLLLLIVPRCVALEEDAQEPAEERPLAPKQPYKPPVPPRPSADAAVQLLALLQREGRLVDFLREDIGAYDDTQVGAAVRTIHEACRKVLTEHLNIEPVLDGSEGDTVTVPEDFDPSAVRLTGHVSGEAPFRGELRHAGWKATSVTLPEQPKGQDPQVIVPAEVEIPE